MVFPIIHLADGAREEAEPEGLVLVTSKSQPQLPFIHLPLAETAQTIRDYTGEWRLTTSPGELIQRASAILNLQDTRGQTHQRRVFLETHDRERATAYAWVDRAGILAGEGVAPISSEDNSIIATLAKKLFRQGADYGN